MNDKADNNNTEAEAGSDKLCNFAPAKEDAAKEDEILFRKTRSYEELVESSDRCCKYVSERLDQIEEEINADSKSDKK